MSDPVTIEDIYALFKASSEEFDLRLMESDRRAEEAKLQSDRTQITKRRVCYATLTHRHIHAKILIKYLVSDIKQLIESMRPLFSLLTETYWPLS